MSLPAGVEGNSIPGAESNGEAAQGVDLGDGWPEGLDGLGGATLEERVGSGASEMGEAAGLEDGLDESPPSDHVENWEDLTLPSQPGALGGGDTAVPRAVFILPLEGSNAELRTRVIKEVRKPGRSKSVEKRWLLSGRLSGQPTSHGELCFPQIMSRFSGSWRK